MREIDQSEFGSELRTALPEWNWTEETIERWHDDFSNDKSLELVIVEDWFARKELDGTQVLWAEREHETENAVLFQHGTDFQSRHERQGHFQPHITEAWVPKSVIKTVISWEI